MKKLSKVLKQMANGLAFAHAGDYLSQREKTDVLGESSGLVEQKSVRNEAAKASQGSSRRRVALYLGSELPGEVMNYVIQTCSNLQHDLTVLTFETKNKACVLIKPYEAELKASGIDVKLKRLPAGDPISGLARYLKRRPEIAFLACKENGYLGRCYIKGIKDTNMIPVPVVVVACGKDSTDGQVLPASQEKADKAQIA